MEPLKEYEWRCNVIRRVFGKEHSNSGKLADHGRSSWSNPGVWVTNNGGSDQGDRNSGGERWAGSGNASSSEINRM